MHTVCTYKHCVLDLLCADTHQRFSPLSDALSELNDLQLHEINADVDTSSLIKPLISYTHGQRVPHCFFPSELPPTSQRFKHD